MPLLPPSSLRAVASLLALAPAATPPSHAAAVQGGAGDPAGASFTGCAPEWTSTFGGALGTNYYIQVLAVYDDGSGAGPALYAGGVFTVAGSQPADRIARWDGAGWSALGGGMDGHVHALCVFDDGTGPALYAGGEFATAGGQPASRIARWDGQVWSTLGTGMNDQVRALAVYDDGSGPALYAGGSFSSAGGQAANHVARWDGQSWENALGHGTNDTVNALAVYDDGSGKGPGLYVGGHFEVAGGQSAQQIARWDAQGWSALGSGLDDTVHSMIVHDDGAGAGPSLFVGARHVERWDGQSWSTIGGMFIWSGAYSTVFSLAVCDDGSGAGPALYAAGEFDSVGGQEARNIARWDGQTWTPLGSGLTADVEILEAAYALAVFDEGSGEGHALFAGGFFEYAGEESVAHVARWNGQDWSPLGKGLSSDIEALTVFDDGSGPALYAAGYFDNVGGMEARCVAKWDGQGWSALGSGLAGFVGIWPISTSASALAVFDDGSGGGPALYVGGTFAEAGGVAASNIARWDGQGWSALGPGLNNSVYALTVFDDGSGPALYAGGAFSKAGAHFVSHVGKWDGQGWSPLGSGVGSRVYALQVFDDGSGAGPALYAGGMFPTAGGQPAEHVARWDGQSWSALGLGTNSYVRALAVCDDGTGPALYAGGNFTLAGGLSAAHVARWNGHAWSALGSGLDDDAIALAVLDAGSGLGPALYAGGSFESAGGQVAEQVARWDGQGWSGLGSGIGEGVFGAPPEVRELFSFDDGSGAGPALLAGGEFLVSASGDSYLARYGCPESSIEDLPGCFGNPATLAALSSALSLGDVFSCQLSASQLASGLGLLFFGADGTDAAGCGVLLPGVGELLLSLTAHAQVGSGRLSAGAITFDLPVPAGPPSLVGLEVAFHGAIVGVFDPGFPIELSNGLVAVIHP